MQTGTNIFPGQVVISLAGRDVNQYYVVIALAKSRAVLVDGKHRKADNPKYKNFRHLRVYANPDPDLERKIDEGKRITDADIRQVLRALVEKEGWQ